MHSGRPGEAWIWGWGNGGKGGVHTHSTSSAITSRLGSSPCANSYGEVLAGFRKTYWDDSPPLTESRGRPPSDHPLPPCPTPASFQPASSSRRPLPRHSSLLISTSALDQALPTLKRPVQMTPFLEGLSGHPNEFNSFLFLRAQPSTLPSRHRAPVPHHSPEFQCLSYTIWQIGGQGQASSLAQHSARPISFM